MVQVAPFVYALFCIVAYVLYLFATDDAIWIANLFLYISPVVVINNLINSRILKLCRWHKTTCILPLLPNASVAFDRYIYELPVSYATANVITILVLSGLLLIAAYNVFFR